ncbi:MAG: ATP-grasp domain-containing protein [Phycisphaerae bacterium]
MSIGNVSILFTCGGRRVALLEQFRRAMADLGITGRLIVTDITPASSAFQAADEGVIVPRADAPDYLDSLESIVVSRKVGLVVPLTDLDLLILARHRERLQRHGCVVMIGSKESVATCRNKSRTADFLEECGLAGIRTQTLDAFGESPTFPCFVKPVGGSGSIGAGRIDSMAELEAHVKRHGRELIVQELVGGQEFTVDVYVSRSGAVRAIVPRLRLAVRAGEVEKGLTLRDPELIDAAERICRGLPGLWGAFCCQCRRALGEDGQPAGPAKFFEINPRFGGGMPLSIAAGADLPRYLLEDVLNMPTSDGRAEFTDRLLMLRYDDAVFRPVEDIRSLPGFASPSFR